MLSYKYTIIYFLIGLLILYFILELHLFYNLDFKIVLSYKYLYAYSFYNVVVEL